MAPLSMSADELFDEERVAIGLLQDHPAQPNWQVRYAKQVFK